TDNTRWRYFSLTRSPFGRGGARVPTDFYTIRMMNRTPRGGPFTLSSDEKTLTLQNTGPTLPKQLTIDSPTEKRITLTGVANGKALEIKLHKINREDFLLINRGYHWINELPLNR